MNYCKIFSLVAIVVVILASTSIAQDTSSLPCMDPKLSPGRAGGRSRASDDAGREGLAARQSVQGHSALDVPAYDWWSEALHGVVPTARPNFPNPSVWPRLSMCPRIHEMATAIGVEGRIKHMQQNTRALQHLRRPRLLGAQCQYLPRSALGAWPGDLWRRSVPQRPPGGGLCDRDAGDGPQYYRVIATPKHYAVHSGPEPTRHFADVDVSKHDEEDTYLPAFRAAVVEGHAGSVMCAYNAINGEPACASEFLLQHTLRGAWEFQGYVVSDCDAVRNVFNGHRYRPTQAQASAISVIRGMDNECIDFAKVSDDHDYRPYIEAVQRVICRKARSTPLSFACSPPGSVSACSIRRRRVPYMNIDEKQLDSAAHRELARRIANESMVLLKNDGALPLKSAKRIPIVGPLADQTAVLLGNYNGSPSHTVSVLEGMKAEFPEAKITYVPGTQFLSNQAIPCRLPS